MLLPMLQTLPGATFSEMPISYVKLNVYPKKQLLGSFRSMKHLLVSIRNLSGNVPDEFSYVSKFGHTDLLHRMYVDDENSKAILHGQEL